MKTQLQKYDDTYRTLRAENAKLKKQVDSSKESIRYRMEVAQQFQELEELRQTVENIPPEILREFQSSPNHGEKER